MIYNKEFWNKYADENETRYNEEFSKFTKDLASSLQCTSVLEIGCGTGIDLRLFPDTFTIYGVDLNSHALEIAKEKFPNASFKIGDITNLPFEDSSIDFVFTHGLLNYIEDDVLDQGVKEMYRVARKYIMNCEKFNENEEQIDENHKYRNMYNRWINYKVKIISNVDMHEDIEPEKNRFTLIKKIQ